MDLTFYHDFQNRRVVLPLLSVPAKTPGAGEGHGDKKISPPAMKAVAMAVAKPAEPTNAPPWNRNDKAAEVPAEVATLSHNRFMVQVLVIPEFDKAAAVASRLQRQGVNAQISRANMSGNTVYRVQVGPFPSREEASSKAQLWKVDGIIITESAG